MGLKCIKKILMILRFVAFVSQAYCFSQNIFVSYQKILTDAFIDSFNF